MLLSNYTPPPHNQTDLAKLIRGMQDESTAKARESTAFSELGQAVVQQGVADKLASRWGKPVAPVAEKKVM